MLSKQEFDTNGYAVVKNVFSLKEVDELRTKVYAQLEIDKKNNNLNKIGNTSAVTCIGDILSKEILSDVIQEDRILNIVKSALGTNEIVYFRDSSYMVGTGFRGWHRDNIDRKFNSGPDWQGEYNVVRLGLYLQNHKNYSGGLKVQKFSHKKESGPVDIIDSEVGDLIIWFLTTKHSGNAVRLKLFKNISLNHLENHVPKFLKLEEEKERISIFMSFGVSGNHLNRYLTEYLLKRETTKQHIRISQLSNQGFINDKVSVMKFQI